MNKGILIGKCENCHWEHWSGVYSDKVLMGSKCNECFGKYKRECRHLMGPDLFTNSSNVCEHCDGKLPPTPTSEPPVTVSNFVINYTACIMGISKKYVDALWTHHYDD